MTGEWEPTAPLPPVVGKVEPKTPLGLGLVRADPPGAANDYDALFEAFETDRLERWKAEALPLLAQLERCHDLLPPSAQAQLGHSKADAVERYLANLRR